MKRRRGNWVSQLSTKAVPKLIGLAKTGLGLVHYFPLLCAKLEADSTTWMQVTADVWKPIGKGNDERSDVGSRKIGENKLLSSKR